MLKETLEDRRLSRAEKRALGAVISEAKLDDDELMLARAHAFDLVRAEFADPHNHELLDWLEEIVKVLAPKTHSTGLAEAKFSPGNECRNAVISQLDRARSSIDVCVFTITDDRIAERILAAHSRGVKVRVLTDDEKSTDIGSDVDTLASAGIPVRSDNSEHHMHHKFALFDATVLLTGSYNWTGSATCHNQENLILTDEPRLIRAYTQTFESLWSKFGDLYALA
jgi:phosphatidylserine/phosphatidylglycerophosphate/cardiolipin synthase-like enzyme